MYLTGSEQTKQQLNQKEGKPVGLAFFACDLLFGLDSSMGES